MKEGNSSFASEGDDLEVGSPSKRIAISPMQLRIASLSFSRDSNESPDITPQTPSKIKAESLSYVPDSSTINSSQLITSRWKIRLLTFSILLILLFARFYKFKTFSKYQVKPIGRLPQVKPKSIPLIPVSSGSESSLNMDSSVIP
jgi:hypothetical protein